jgi:hypothetical protein
MGEGAHIQGRSMALGNHEKKVTEGLVRAACADKVTKRLEIVLHKDGIIQYAGA